MKIFVYDSGSIDLEAPVQMTDWQREKFINFFKRNFPDSKIVEVDEPDRWPIGGEDGIRTWSEEEYLLLLSDEENDVIAKKLNRSPMGVQMKRGQFLPDFFVWLQKKGYVISKNVDKSVIKAYLDDKKEGRV